MSPTLLLRLDRLYLTFGGKPLFNNVNLSIASEEKIALVGSNGSGKSTLLKLSAGLIEPNQGEIFRHPKKTFYYLGQKSDFLGYSTIYEYVSEAAVFSKDVDYIYYLLNLFNLDPKKSFGELSGGEAKKVALIKLFIASPDVFLLDEPTNHLDVKMIEWLEQSLIKTKSAVIVVSHDRRFLEKISQKTIWLDQGITHSINKNFFYFAGWKEKFLQEEQKLHHKTTQYLVKEENWLRYGITGRRKRNVRRLGDLISLKKKIKEILPRSEINVQKQFYETQTGQRIVEARNISKAYGNKKLIENFSLKIQKGDKIGIVGPNGSGKTTLISLLIKRFPPDKGSVKLGTNLNIEVLSQHRAFEEGETLSHYLTDGRGDSLLVNGVEKHILSYMRDFLFQPEQIHTPVDNLSGGEIARLILARFLSRPCNFLVLDEPTNDLDLETLDRVQKILKEFKGTLLLVSHNRDFLDGLVTRTIAAEENATWTVYAGGYSDMLLQRNKKETVLYKNTPKINKKTACSATFLAPKKLSYKDKFLLETIPKKLEELLIKIQKTEYLLAEPHVYQSEVKELTKLVNLLSEQKKEYETLENKWLELEMQREELEQNSGLKRR